MAGRATVRHLESIVANLRDERDTAIEDLHDMTVRCDQLEAELSRRGIALPDWPRVEALKPKQHTLL